MGVCFIALSVYLSPPGSNPIIGRALIARPAITSMVQAVAEHNTGSRLETRITLQGGGQPLYTLLAPHEVARLPCQDL